MEISSDDRWFKKVKIAEIEDNFSNFILKWYKKNERDFPWRKTQNPYEVMIAEIMLQRTKAEQVLPVYIKFLQKFDNLKELSSASENELFDFFSKLGLTRRVKCLEVLSKKLIIEYDGKIPESREELLSLPCIGEYSADAILCFAYDKKVSIVDSNICRVFRRLFDLKPKGDLRRNRSFKKILTKMLPVCGYKEFNWALIDLGATICRPRKPLCNFCPVKSLCSYFKNLKNLSLE